MESIEGKALVASPYLTERNFLRSVVYILRHNENGAFGLILNRPTELTVGDLMSRLSDDQPANAEPIYCGGPVEAPLLIVHDRSSAGETEGFEFSSALGLHVTTDQDDIFDIWEKQDCRYRCFDGYSGWSPGQLESELKAGGWLVWDASPDTVFADPEPMWKRAVQQIGREILAVQIEPSRMPIDPAAN